MGCKIYEDENVCAKEGRRSARACVSEGGVSEDVKVTLARFDVCVFACQVYSSAVAVAKGAAM